MHKQSTYVILLVMHFLRWGRAQTQNIINSTFEWKKAQLPVREKNETRRRIFGPCPGFMPFWQLLEL